MKSSGGILRGHLRPIGARSPPLVVIGLLVILAFLGFNYWNLTYEYDAIVKEISVLQDQLKLAYLKKERVEKQNEEAEKRFVQAQEQLGKEKLTGDQTKKQLAESERKLEMQNSEFVDLKSQFENCQSANAKLTSNQDVITDLQKRVNQLEEDKNNLSSINSQIISEKADLRLKIEELERNLAMLNAMRNEHDPFQQIHPAQNSGINTTTTTMKNIISSPEKVNDKSKDYTNEANVLKPPNLNLSNQNINETKMTKNESQMDKIADREDGELIIGGNLDPDLKEKQIDENISKEVILIEDNGVKSIKPDTNATLEEDMRKAPKLEIPKLDDAQVAKPLNLSEHSVNDWKDNAV